MSRAFSTTTPLGRIMADRGVTKQEVVAATYLAGAGVHERTFTNYLNGTAPILNHHLRALASALEVDPEDLL